MSIWKHFFSLQVQRRRLLRRIASGPMHDYYAAPFPDPQEDWRKIDYLALDFETTGLDTRADEILSIGFVTLRGSIIQLASATHLFVRPTQPIPEKTAVVHGIMDDQAARAEALHEVMPKLLSALAGKVMIAHHAVVEYVFLDKACRQLYGQPFIAPVIDTLELENRAFRRRDHLPKPGELRLAAARERYGLPRYPAHDALLDALAAGELFLAQCATYLAGKNQTLKQLQILL